MRRWAGRAIFLVCVLGCHVPSLHAALDNDQRRAIAQEALTAYEHGIELRQSNPERSREAFRESVTRFQQLVDDGVSTGPMYYNLGNALFQTGRIGAAIAAYRSAQQFMPRHSGLRHNLAYVRSQCRNQIQPSGSQALIDAVTAGHRSIPLRWRVALFSVAYALFWAIVVVWVARPSRVWFWPAVGLGVVWLVVSTSIMWEWYGPETLEGVLVDDDVVVRKGDGEGYEREFQEPLHQGVELRITEQRGEWAKVELVNGKSGWVKRKSLRLVDPGS